MSDFELRVSQVRWNVVTRDNGVIVDPNELSMVANQMTDYAKFLLDAIDEYVRILEVARSRALIDVNLYFRLGAYISYIKQCKAPLADCCNVMNCELNNFLNEAKLADNFCFPENFDDKISKVWHYVF